MTLSATEIYDRLVDLSDGQEPFALADGVTESDVQTWLDGVDVVALKTSADREIDRETVSDHSAEIANGYSLAEVIRSHNDDPETYGAAYVIRAQGQQIVQYKQPQVGGNQAMTDSEADDARENHVSTIVTRTVNAELLRRARLEFGQ